tara:strand:- start:983 stop:1717 length:735 start_codon:yes stop_codon:yes gene_type:complete
MSKINCIECNKLCDEDQTLLNKCPMCNREEELDNSSNQSQKHGFVIENEIKSKVFDLPKEKNNTKIHDIPKEDNKFNDQENISIKSTKSNNIDCGDILRFFNYNFTDINTIIILNYEQNGDFKDIKKIYEVNYCKNLHKLLFGNVTYQVLENYVNNVKKIPKKVSGDDAKIIFDYLTEKKKIQKDYKMKINISPKVDSKQSRVQCSIPKFSELCKDYILSESDNYLIRNKKIFKSFKSSMRIRN